MSYQGSIYQTTVLKCVCLKVIMVTMGVKLQVAKRLAVSVQGGGIWDFFKLWGVSCLMGLVHVTFASGMNPELFKW